MDEWGTRHSRDRKKKKGDVGVEMKEEEGEKIELFFCNVYEFLTDFASVLNPVPCPVISPVGTPVAVTDFLHSVPVISRSDSSQCITTS